MSLISSRNLVSVTIVVAAIVAALEGVPPASAQKSPSPDSPLPPPNFMVTGTVGCTAGISPPCSIGTATGTQLQLSSCLSGGVTGTTCWGLNISGCPNPATLPYDATVKVTSPTVASIGTIIFLSGATGVQFYDQEFGSAAVSMINSLVSAGYTAVQIMYDNTVAGWLTGPATDGPLDLACLPSTSMQWVHDHILGSGTPLCATGNSGGSQQIAYALSQYGLGSGTTSIFTMAEATSGPELSRMDYGCAPAGKYTACAICGFGKHQESYGLTIAETGIDPAYTGKVTTTPDSSDPCSYDYLNHMTWATQLHHDSILSDVYPPPPSFSTDIHFAFGGADAHSPAIPEGLDWASFITSATAIVCVPTGNHELPSTSAGAARIESDLTTYCKLP
ncbi:MAG TPA: hypothetical protein VG206_11525 [Terriglobia bacterium]|nr:hypothetical protein [Terriglobia bacterium]